MIVLQGIALIVSLIMWYKKHPALDINLDIVSKVSGMLFAVMIMRMAVMYGQELPVTPIDPHHMLFVFWEDFCFGGSIILFESYVSNKKKYFLPFVILVSASFGLGHAYQGLFIVGLTSLLPYFVVRKYGMRYGLFTTGMIHVVYDISTVMTFKIMTLINLLHI